METSTDPSSALSPPYGVKLSLTLLYSHTMKTASLTYLDKIFELIFTIHPGHFLIYFLALFVYLLNRYLQVYTKTLKKGQVFEWRKFFDGILVASFVATVFLGYIWLIICDQMADHKFSEAAACFIAAGVVAGNSTLYGALKSRANFKASKHLDDVDEGGTGV